VQRVGHVASAAVGDTYQVMTRRQRQGIAATCAPDTLRQNNIAGMACEHNTMQTLTTRCLAIACPAK